MNNEKLYNSMPVTVPEGSNILMSNLHKSVHILLEYIQPIYMYSTHVLVIL